MDAANKDAAVESTEWQFVLAVRRLRKAEHALRTTRPTTAEGACLWAAAWLSWVADEGVEHKDLDPMEFDLSQPLASWLRDAALTLKVFA